MVMTPGFFICHFLTGNLPPETTTPAKWNRLIKGRSGEQAQPAVKSQSVAAALRQAQGHGRRKIPALAHRFHINPIRTATSVPDGFLKGDLPVPYIAKRFNQPILRPALPHASCPNEGRSSCEGAAKRPRMPRSKFCCNKPQ